MKQLRAVPKIVDVVTGSVISRAGRVIKQGSNGHRQILMLDVTLCSHGTAFARYTAVTRDTRDNDGFGRR
jgi:hypothetical protein